jgi:radical SAM superfamily enzyme YgiQ (UPF0313 family)
VSDQALDRWLLVNYAGYPYAPNSLMPDNGLANLAGALLADQRHVEILDYGTVNTLRRMSSPELLQQLARAWDSLRGTGWVAALKKLGLLVPLQNCERARQRLQDQVVAEIGREIVARIRERSVQAVGFKLWSGDGLEGSVRIASYVRAQSPATKLFGGGPQVDFFMERILARHPCFDALVFGEGEDTIRYLAHAGADPSSYATIPNLIYRRDGQMRRTTETMITNLDDLPIPAYDPSIYPALRGDEKIRVFVIDESRGCRNDCAFCIHPIKSHRRLRTKGVPRLMREVGLLARQCGCRTFRFAGSCTPYGLLNAFAAEVVKQGAVVAYASFAHVRDSQEADFELMRRSGCQALFFGLESGSQRILDRMHKHINASEIPTTVRRVKATGIFAVGSLIFPAPGDDAASERETLDVLAAEKPNSVTLQAPVVAPRTEWFESPGEHGVRFADREEYLDAAMAWKIKLILPPSFWSPLPVQIDGRSYRQVLRKAMRFSRRLGELGIATSISDETYLMSIKAGMDAVAFRDKIVGAFFSGDADVIAAVTAQINAQV